MGLPGNPFVSKESNELKKNWHFSGVISKRFELKIGKFQDDWGKLSNINNLIKKCSVFWPTLYI